MKAEPSPLFLLALASGLWAACNILWRNGEGNVLALAGQRGAIGVLLFSPVLVAAFRDGRLKRALTDRASLLAMFAAGLTVPASATMLRTLEGPQAALVATLTPVAIIIAASVLRGFNNAAVPAVVITVVAGVGAVLIGGVKQFDGVELAAGGAVIVADVVAMLAAERARERHDAMVLVVGGLAMGALGCWLAIAIVQPPGAVHLSGLAIATLVGLLGTSARFLRTHVLPKVGSAVANSTSQLTALGTAAGGVILFNDKLEAPAAVLMVIAALASLIAVNLAQRQKQQS